MSTANNRTENPVVIPRWMVLIGLPLIVGAAIQEGYKHEVPKDLPFSQEDAQMALADVKVALLTNFIVNLLGQAENIFARQREDYLGAAINGIGIVEKQFDFFTTASKSPVNAVKGVLSAFDALLARTQSLIKGEAPAAPANPPKADYIPPTTAILKDGQMIDVLSTDAEILTANNHALTQAIEAYNGATDTQGRELAAVQAEMDKQSVAIGSNKGPVVAFFSPLLPLFSVLRQYITKSGVDLPSLTGIKIQSGQKTVILSPSQIVTYTADALVQLGRQRILDLNQHLTELDDSFTIIGGKASQALKGQKQTIETSHSTVQSAVSEAQQTLTSLEQQAVTISQARSREEIFQLSPGLEKLIGRIIDDEIKNHGEVREPVRKQLAEIVLFHCDNDGNLPFSTAILGALGMVGGWSDRRHRRPPVRTAGRSEHSRPPTTVSRRTFSVAAAGAIAAVAGGGGYLGGRLLKDYQNVIVNYLKVRAKLPLADLKIMALDNILKLAGLTGLPIANAYQQVVALGTDFAKVPVELLGYANNVYLAGITELVNRLNLSIVAFGQVAETMAEAPLNVYMALLDAEATILGKLGDAIIQTRSTLDSALSAIQKTYTRAENYIAKAFGIKPEQAGQFMTSGTGYKLAAILTVLFGSLPRTGFIGFEAESIGKAVFGGAQLAGQVAKPIRSLQDLTEATAGVRAKCVQLKTDLLQFCSSLFGDTKAILAQTRDQAAASRQEMDKKRAAVQSSFGAITGHLDGARTDVDQLVKAFQPLQANAGAASAVVAIFSDPALIDKVVAIAQANGKKLNADIDPQALLAVLLPYLKLDPAALAVCQQFINSGRK